MNKKLRTLIVEDSEDDTLLLVRELRRGGYDPVFLRVDTQAEMDEALEQNTWDVVISDYSMPRFSAFDALSRLKEKNLDIPFIIVSGAIGEETAVAAMKCGAHDYIMKDNLKRLIPAIEREVRDAEVRKERGRTEKALQESEERYRSLVENLDMGITLIDSDYTVLMTNAARGRIFRKMSSQVMGRKCYEDFGQHESICEHCPAVRAMATGMPGEADTRVDCGEAGSFTVRIRAFPTFSEDGQVTGCIEVVEDITDRKRLEQQLRRAAQMEAIGRLAGGVAHDFNNLLTAMIGYSDVLLQEIPENDPLREKVIQITYAAERAAGLTRQLLAFGRKQVLDVKVLDLNALVAEFEKMLRSLVGEDIELVTHFDPDLHKVKADRSQVEQILLNLVVNARDAMPKGGKISMKTANVFLDEESTRIHPGVVPGMYVMLSVTDTGSGMDRQTLTRIFDPFFTTKEEGKGTGLGLSTVYGIVKQHRGHIFVRSELSRGAVFEICLPRCEEDEERTTGAVEQKPLLQGKETVLVVEDEEIVRKVTCEGLEMLGYTVLSAAQPDAALTISARYDGPIHLLFTDVVLPRMDGAALFHRLAPERPLMKVLYVSGYPQSSFIHRGVLKQGSAFLQKPFTFDMLAAKVREVLDSPADSTVSQSGSW